MGWAAPRGSQAEVNCVTTAQCPQESSPDHGSTTRLREKGQVIPGSGIQSCPFSTPKSSSSLCSHSLLLLSRPLSPPCSTRTTWTPGTDLGQPGKAPCPQPLSCCPPPPPPPPPSSLCLGLGEFLQCLGISRGTGLAVAGRPGPSHLRLVGMSHHIGPVLGGPQPVDSSLPSLPFAMGTGSQARA